MTTTRCRAACVNPIGMKFLITYTDPKTGEEVRIVKEFGNTDNISAYEWAEDWAYMAADKGPYKIEEVT